MSHCGRPSSCSSVTSAAAWVPRVPRVSWQHLQKPWSLWCLYGKIWEIHQFNEIYNGFMWINWIYNHLSAKLSLSLYMRDCHCFFSCSLYLPPALGNRAHECQNLRHPSHRTSWNRRIPKWLQRQNETDQALTKICGKMVGPVFTIQILRFPAKKKSMVFGQKPCKLRR